VRKELSNRKQSLNSTCLLFIGLFSFTGVNFIKVKRTNFLYKRHFSSFYYIHITREKLPKQRSFEKFAWNWLQEGGIMENSRRGSTGATLSMGAKLNLNKALSKARRLNIGRCNSDAAQVQAQLAKVAAVTSKYLTENSYSNSCWSSKRNS